MKEIIKTDNAPQAIGPYSQAVKCGNLLFVSGQIAIDPSTGDMIEGSITDKFNRTMDNIKAILEAAGMGLKDVVKVTVFFKDISDFATVNKAYANYFTSDYPAREAVEVARLPKDADIEVSCIASRE